MKVLKVMQKIIAALIITYTFGIFISTVTDLEKIHSLQASATQTEQPTHHGNGRR